MQAAQGTWDGRDGAGPGPRPSDGPEKNGPRAGSCSVGPAKNLFLALPGNDQFFCLHIYVKKIQTEYKDLAAWGMIGQSRVVCDFFIVLSFSQHLHLTTLLRSWRRMFNQAGLNLILNLAQNSQRPLPGVSGSGGVSVPMLQFD